MHYTIETDANGKWKRVYETPEPKSAERVIYASAKGGKPLNIGINQAKRIARAADRQNTLAVRKILGFGLPRQHSHHQELVRRRHQYYHDQHEEFLRGQPSAT